MTDAARTPFERARRLALTGLVVAMLVVGCTDRNDKVEAQPSSSPTPEPTALATSLPGTPSEAPPQPSATAFLRPTSVIDPTPEIRPPAIDSVVARAAAEHGINQADVTVIFYEQRTWPSTALGCPEVGRFYPQIVTRGYEVTLGVKGTLAVYHADETGATVVRCGAGSTPTS